MFLLSGVVSEPIYGHLNGCYWNRFALDRLIHFKPFRFHAVPLFKLSYVLPLNFLYFKTICLIMHDVFNNVTPPNVSSLFTYSSKVHQHNTRFSVAGNFYIKHSRTNHMKNSFSRIGVKIPNSIPDSDRALPKYKFKNTLHSRLLDILILMLARVL